MWEKQRTSTLLRPPQSEEAEFDLLCHLGPILTRPQPEDRASSFSEFMTAANNSLSLILRRLDEIERKIDQVLEELQTLHTPAAIGYSVRRGNLPRKD